MTVMRYGIGACALVCVCVFVMNLYVYVCLCVRAHVCCVFVRFYVRSVFVFCVGCVGVMLCVCACLYTFSLCVCVCLFVSVCIHNAHGRVRTLSACQ